MRPSTRIACSASPVQISFGRAASNRPNTGVASAVTSVVSPVRLNIRWIVRSSGAHPDCALRIRWTCAAVRAGFSFFSAAASASTSGGVRGWDWRGDGTSASNPPRRHARIHTSSVHRVTRTGSPDGPGVLAGRDLPHHRAALPRGQRRVSSLPDQHVPEQPDRPGPLQPRLLFLFSLAHAHQGHLLRSVK